jgi:hypothetical protein
MWWWLGCAGAEPAGEEGGAVVAEAPSPASSSPACPADVSSLPADPRLQGTAVVVWKGARAAAVYRGGVLAGTEAGPACWRVALAPGAPEGAKQRQGDLRTPEGWYRTWDRPWSRFSHALTISYPGPADAERGLRDGLVTAAQAEAIRAAAAADRPPPMDTALGGLILLHGGGSAADWTLGCVAFEDADLVALRSLLPAELRSDVLILP